MQLLFSKTNVSSCVFMLESCHLLALFIIRASSHVRRKQINTVTVYIFRGRVSLWTWLTCVFLSSVLSGHPITAGSYPPVCNLPAVMSHTDAASPADSITSSSRHDGHQLLPSQLPTPTRVMIPEEESLVISKRQSTRNGDIPSYIFLYNVFLLLL